MISIIISTLSILVSSYAIYTVYKSNKELEEKREEIKRFIEKSENND